jgi:hypothetical protein
MTSRDKIIESIRRNKEKKKQIGDEGNRVL